MNVRRIPLVDLRRDGGTQVRETMNAATVQDYADALAEGVEFPPIVVFFDGEAHWLADGFHRVLAHERAGLVDVLAEVRTGSKRDALLFAVGANANHGLPRTNKDKRRAVEILLKDEEWAFKTGRAIAKKAGVHHDLVSEVRAGMPSGELAESANSPQTRTGKDGKQYPVKKTKAPTAPAPEAPADPTPLVNLTSHPAVAAIASAPTRDALETAYTAANGARLSAHDAEEAGKVYQRKAAELRAQAPATTPTVPTHEQVDLFTQAAPAAASAPRGAHGETAAKETSSAPVPPTVPAADAAAEVAALRAEVEAYRAWINGLCEQPVSNGTVNLDKVRRLIALSRSPNENEARNAAALACKAICDAGLIVISADDPRLNGSGTDLDMAALKRSMTDAFVDIFNMARAARVHP